MIGLSRRSSSSEPTSGSEAATGVPCGRGVAVGGGVGRAVPGTGVLMGGAVGGGSVGRGVSRLAGFSEVGVGGTTGAAGTFGPHPAKASVIRVRMGNRRCMPAARLEEIYGTAFALDLEVLGARLPTRRRP